ASRRGEDGSADHRVQARRVAATGAQGYPSNLTHAFPAEKGAILRRSRRRFCAARDAAKGARILVGGCRVNALRRDRALSGGPERVHCGKRRRGARLKQRLIMATEKDVRRALRKVKDPE